MGEQVTSLQDTLATLGDKFAALGNRVENRLARQEASMAEIHQQLTHVTQFIVAFEARQQQPQQSWSSGNWYGQSGGWCTNNTWSNAGAGDNANNEEDGTSLNADELEEESPEDREFLEFLADGSQRARERSPRGSVKKSTS